MNFTDPTGLKPGDRFKTLDEAAIDFGMTYNDDSIRRNLEIGTELYKNEDGTYSYEIPHTGTKNSVTQVDTPDVVASAHTHSAYSGDPGENSPSLGPGADTGNAQKQNKPMYVATPSGILYKITPSGNGDETDIGSFGPISTGLPSDPKEKNRRQNNNDPSKGNVDPTITQEQYLAQHGASAMTNHRSTNENGAGCNE